MRATIKKRDRWRKDVSMWSWISSSCGFISSKVVSVGSWAKGLVSWTSSGWSFATSYFSSLGTSAAAVAFLYGLYNWLVTEPLRRFYFVGPIWHNSPPQEICYEMTGVAATWWNSTDERMGECYALLDRRFESFDTTVFCILYFGFLFLAVAYLVCRWCFVAPVVRGIQDLLHVER